MADFNEMDALELPEMNEKDYTDIPDAYDDMSADAETEEPIVTDMDDDFSDMPMPVLSEMDGSAPVSPADSVRMASEKKSEAANTPKSEITFEEMGGYTPPRPVPSANTQQTAPQTNADNTYRSVYSPVSQQSSQSAMGALYSMRSEDMQNINDGEKLARTIGIILIVLAVLGLLSCLTDVSSNITQIIRNVLQIIIVRGFMQGKNSDRLFLGWLNAISAVLSVFAIGLMSTVTDTMAEYGMSFFTTIMQLALFINLIGSGVMAYFLLINKKIKAFCCG